MRKIKFRGKIIDMSTSWKYGNLVICDNGDYQIGSCRKNGDTYFRNEVYPETVGQYTGLKDKNGKEIYEGDIVKTRKGIKQTIVFYEGCFVCKNIGDKELWHIAKDDEIIGNIWDNKELLED